MQLPLYLRAIKVKEKIICIRKKIHGRYLLIFEWTKVILFFPLAKFNIILTAILMKKNFHIKSG
ncbi:hypothetical protein EZS27_001291 [termite gut metagenome]|uniref:Uncharacterized protein n=1 Tax=termite gut metagenome TaxID=433724 RepID=A0A5J4SZH1_9ZZZZ